MGFVYGLKQSQGLLHDVFILFELIWHAVSVIGDFDCVNIAVADILRPIAAV